MSSSTVCPRGFVIPTNPTSSLNIYINQTASDCAVSCFDPPFYTSGEFDVLQLAGTLTAACAAACAFVVLYLWLIDEVKSKQIFVVTTGAVVTIGCTFVAIVSPLEDRCADNANPVTATLSLCSINGAVNYCIFMVVSSSFFLQSFELYRKIVLLCRDEKYRDWYRSILVGMPVLFCTIGFALSSFGPGELGDDYCAIHKVTPVTRGLLFIPMVVLVAFGSLICLRIVWHIFSLARAPIEEPGLSSTDATLLASTSMRFLVFTGFFLLSTFALRNIFSHEDRKASILTWGQCCLNNINGPYLDICGNLPRRKFPFASYLIYEVYIRAGVGIFFLVVNIEGVFMLIRRYICKASITPMMTRGNYYSFPDIMSFTQSEVGVYILYSPRNNPSIAGAEGVVGAADYSDQSFDLSAPHSVIGSGSVSDLSLENI